MSTSDKVTLSLPDIAARLRQATIPPVDAVIGIARGGVVPASLVAYEHHLPLVIMRLNYRDDSNTPRYDAPHLIAPPDLTGITAAGESLRLLVVDDVSVSGKTLATARQILANYHITTLVMKGQGDIVLFPEVGACVNWPWAIP